MSIVQERRDLVQSAFSRGLSLIGGTSILAAILTIASGVLLARLLGAEDRGLFGVFQTTATLIVALVSFSIFDASTIKMRENFIDREAVFQAFVRLSIGVLPIAAASICVLVFLLGVKIEPFSDWTYALLLFCFCAFAVFNQIMQSRERADLHFGILAAEKLITPVIYIAFISAAFFIGEGALFFVIISLIIIKLPFLIFRLFRYREFISIRSGVFVLGAIATSAKLHAQNTIVHVTREADKVAAVLFWAPETFGVYLVAFSLVSAANTVIVQSFVSVGIPSAAGLKGEDFSKLSEKMIRVAIFLALMAAVSVSALAPFVVPILFGAEFERASSYVLALSIALFFGVICSVLTALLNARGLTAYPIIGRLLVLGIFAACYFIMGLGEVVGVVSALIVGNALCLVVLMARVKRADIGVVLSRSLIIESNDLSDLASWGPKRGVKVRSDGVANGK